MKTSTLGSFMMLQNKVWSTKLIFQFQFNHYGGVTFPLRHSTVSICSPANIMFTSSSANISLLYNARHVANQNNTVDTPQRDHLAG